MKKFLTILILFFTGLNLYGQNFTYSGYIYNADGSGAINVPIKLYKRTSSTTTNLSTKVFSTHNGNGNTSQYPQYANSVSDMDKMVNTAYSNTVQKWSGSLAATTILNWSSASTIVNAGATVPNSYEYFSVEVTGTLIPTQTGTYSFGISSDDGSDLLINGSLVTSQYGGHGMGAYSYGSINLTAGTSYTFKARMQEFGGGEGLAVIWKKPSGTTYSIYTDELSGSITWSSWSLYKTIYTNSLGYYSISETSSNSEYYIQIDCPTPTQTLTSADAKAIGDIVLGKTAKNGLSFHMFDLNEDSKLTISDKYYLWGKKNLFWTTWKVAPNSRLYTLSEYNSIKAASTNVRVTYPGVSSITTSTLTSGGTLSYYLIAPGYSGQVTY